MANDNNKPIGERIRDLINPALADSRKPQTQLDILNDVFEQMAGGIERALEQGFANIFNQASTIERRSPNQKNIFIIQQLTTTNERGQPKYAPQVSMQIPIVTTFADFYAHDVKQLPGFIALHEKAREMDVAVRISGLTPDESKAGSGHTMPVILTLDASKTYADGAIEGANLYPNLPEPKVEFDRKADFKFG